VSDERPRHRDGNEADGRRLPGVPKPGMHVRAHRAFAHAVLICAFMLVPRDALSREDPPPWVSVELDEDSSAARVTAAIDIPAPPRAVYAVMVDCSRALRIVTGLESCRVIERSADGTWDIREHIISLNILLPRVRNVFRSEYEQNRLIRFRRVDGDLKVSDGEWRLQPLAGGTATRVTYRAHVALSVPVPGPLVRAAIRYDIPNMLAALRRQSLEGHDK
jgi:ribosome-associated toxin RatA of RatAB toxin-antitoxin module